MSNNVYGRGFTDFSAGLIKANGDEKANQALMAPLCLDQKRVYFSAGGLFGAIVTYRRLVRSDGGPRKARSVNLGASRYNQTGMPCIAHRHRRAPLCLSGRFALEDF